MTSALAIAMMETKTKMEVAVNLRESMLVE
jgi:hypothetical protein